MNSSIKSPPPSRSPRFNRAAFIAYVVFAAWLVLTVLAPLRAHAELLSPPATQGTIVLTPADILPDVEAALGERGAPANAEIEFSHPGQSFAAPQGKLQFDHVSYNPRSGRFVIRLSGPSRIAIAGRVRAPVTLPILRRDIDRGEVIAANDIEYAEQAIAQGSGFAQEAAALVGMKARRPLQASAPVRVRDVVAPLLIERGAIVTLTYSVDGLRLTHQGVALANGAMGDVISVRNIQSDRVLKAIVDAKNLARIASPRYAPKDKNI